MADEAPTHYRYWAFISYSSADAAWARWLHRKIEGYGVPARFVSHGTPVGDPTPKRLKPIFRDRDELPASSDLGAQINDALHASRYLIVVCSPRAAASKWVDKEVEAFREFGRSDRILALIVDGEPHSGDERECFPPQLRQVEPIAADARAEGDGRVNAKLKLISGMLGVGFDALKQRDARRRARRLQIALTLSLLLTAGFAALGWYADTQRVKAEQQRDRAVRTRRQAEDILQFLLFDLRDKLQPVGRLDIIRDVHERVDEYYRTLGVAEDDPMWIHNRLAVHINQGDLLVLEGHRADALKAYEAAREIAAHRVAVNVEDPLWQYDLSVSLEKIGDVLLAQRDLGGAKRVYRQSLAAVQQLATSDPRNTRWQRELAVVQEKLGDVLLARGNLSAAVDAYKESRATRERLTVQQPQNALWQRELSVILNKLGDALFIDGDRVDAHAAYRDGLMIIERLVLSDEHHTGWQYDRSVSYEKIGDVLHAEDDLAGAMSAYRESLTIRHHLATVVPDNTHWQHALAIIHNKRGDVLHDKNDPEGALEAYRNSLRVVEPLALSQPSNVDWQRSLSVSHNRLGDLLLTMSRLPEAEVHYSHSMTIAISIVEIEPDSAESQRDLAVSYFNHYQLYNADDRPEEANDALRRCHQTLRSMRERGMHLDPPATELLEQLDDHFDS